MKSGGIMSKEQHMNYLVWTLGRLIGYLKIMSQLLQVHGVRFKCSVDRL